MREKIRFVYRNLKGFQYCVSKGSQACPFYRKYFHEENMGSLRAKVEIRMKTAQLESYSKREREKEET
jgi:hypothetical protein